MTDTTAEPTEATPNHSTDHSPPRVIGPWAAYAIVAGSMLGVGIFLFPGKIALEVPTVAAFFAVFLVGGLFALAGSVACGELGAMLPKAGGDYVFQREAFGPSVAFASGWVLFAAIFCGSIASLAVAVFQYDVGPLLGVSVGEMRAPVIGSEAGFSLSWSQLGAVGLILLLTVINDLGARVSGAVQTILTLTPIVAMVGLAAYVLIGQPPVVAPYELMSTGATELTFAGLAAAFVFVNFVFSGWINIIYVASEVKRPSVNIPRSMVSA
ncbi:MAG: APA family basic amino acid/polyamine antiporter, partial [Myxococcota bacterium]